MSKTDTKKSSSSLLLRLPPELLTRFKSLVPVRQRTSLISSLVELEVQRRERELEKVARQVEADDVLNEEMKEWDTTVADGIDDHVPTYAETR